MSFTRKTLLALAGALLAYTGSGLSAGEASNKAGPQECVSAAISDIQLSQLEAVDEIRVQLAPNSPTDASLEVTVETIDSDRVLELGGAHYKAVHFAPAMSASTYRVSLFPSMNESALPCLESVELLSKGSTVARFRP